MPPPAAGTVRDSGRNESAGTVSTAHFKLDWRSKWPSVFEKKFMEAVPGDPVVVFPAVIN